MPKKQYVATIGIDFEGCKPSVRVEAGEVIPTLSAEEIEDLLAARLIADKDVYTATLKDTTFKIHGLESEAKQ